MRRWVFVPVFLACPLLVESAQAEYARKFRNPRVGSIRIDWCLNWGTQCGKPAADAYCKERGLGEAEGFTKANDIGATTPTKTLGDGRTCSDAGCDGFAEIRCKAEPKATIPEGSRDIFQGPQAKDSRERMAVPGRPVKRSRGLGPIPKIPEGVTSPPPSQATYSEPKIDGYRVNACLVSTDGDWVAEPGTPEFERQGCGQRVANAFCKEMRYKEAISWRVRQATGYVPTIGHKMGHREARCDGPCTQLVDVTCSDGLTRAVVRDHRPSARKAPRPGAGESEGARSFERPVVFGKRLDWCLGWGERCGEPAATAWCQREGYPGATRWEKEEDIGQTLVLETRKICSSQTCDGFKSISCGGNRAERPTVRDHRAKTAASTEQELLSTRAGAGTEGVGRTARASTMASVTPSASQDASCKGGPISYECRELRKTGACEYQPPGGSQFGRAYDRICCPGSEARNVGEVEPDTVCYCPHLGRQCFGALWLLDMFPEAVERRNQRIAEVAGRGTVRAAEYVVKSLSFANPSVAGKRVDWCLRPGNECGEPAAHAFCRELGYGKATWWMQAADIGANAPTFLLGDRSICNEQSCDGFETITCEKAPVQRADTAVCDAHEYLDDAWVCVDRVICSEPTIYEHAGFGGRPLTVDSQTDAGAWPGYNLAQFRFDRITSSICVPSGWRMTLYEQTDGKGESIEIDGPRQIRRLGTSDFWKWNDRASSVLVRRWTNR